MTDFCEAVRDDLCLHITLDILLPGSGVRRGNIIVRRMTHFARGNISSEDGGDGKVTTDTAEIIMSKQLVPVKKFLTQIGDLPRRVNSFDQII